MENVTTYEHLNSKPQTPVEEMDTDSERKETENTDIGNEKKGTEIQGSTEATVPSPDGHSAMAVTSAKEQTETFTNDAHTEKTTVAASKAPDYDTLYPIFWSLQEHFSNPISLFDHDKLEHFKVGLDQTMSKFKEVQPVEDSRGTSKAYEDSKRGVKRKRGDGPDYIGGNFHPKYLTSRDLFELEVSSENLS